jgi:hypothetical protein
MRLSSCDIRRVATPHVVPIHKLLIGSSLNVKMAPSSMNIVLANAKAGREQLFPRARWF